MADTLKFGTSGLRGPADQFTPMEVRDHVHAFLAVLIGRGARFETILIGRDRRASSPSIADSVAEAAKEAGIDVADAGIAPTPAVAAEALAHGWPAIIVTGSHVPADRNGLKFYRPDGELMKEDEAPLRAALGSKLGANASGRRLTHDVATPYLARTGTWLAVDALAGLRVGLFEHSAAGRELLARALKAHAATVVAFGREEAFVPVDTEALDPGMLGRARTAIRDHGLGAVVSTDGDGDRPLVIDAEGQVIPGDRLGALAARALGIRRLAVPLTASSALEASGWFDTIARTRVGSPYVVAKMQELGSKEPVAGFEANGGFLLGSDLARPNGVLKALPTRDAHLPILVTLAAAREAGSLATLDGQLPPRTMRADRLANTLDTVSQRILARIAEERAYRHGLAPILTDPVGLDMSDGVRLVLPDQVSVHFRQSGNAPELRCYVEAATPQQAEALLGEMMAALARRVKEECSQRD